jgi:hypothetical protein
VSSFCERVSVPVVPQYWTRPQSGRRVLVLDAGEKKDRSFPENRRAWHFEKNSGMALRGGLFLIAQWSDHQNYTQLLLHFDGSTPDTISPEAFGLSY